MNPLADAFANAADDIVLLPAADVFDTLAVVAEAGLDVRCVLLDPWYNKGIGGVSNDDDYDGFVLDLLATAGAVADHVYLWGFPEIMARFVTRLPAPLELVAWLTWYYKNSPSVIRGWRSAQMTCLHLARPRALLYPEHFLNEAQLALKAQGKLRYMPGPPSVIEAALLVGFIGKAEQTGHPAQKPVNVIEPLLKMVLAPGELVVDPMCGSGTTGAAARALGCKAILADGSADYTELVATRLGVAVTPITRAPLG